MKTTDAVKGADPFNEPRPSRRSLLAAGAGLLCVAAAPALASPFVHVLGDRAEHLVVVKSRRVLGLMRGTETLKSYRVHLGFTPEGHKTQSGDGRTPEGQYWIDRRNPRSEFYLSLGISYPNANDVARARALGVRPGGDIFIHGGPRAAAQQGRKDWTAGCIAVNDPEMDEIWSMVPTGTPIRILA